MKSAVVLTALVVTLSLAVSASASIGWYAKWNGSAPLTVKVTGVDKLPAAEQPVALAAMSDWSLAPSVDLVPGSGKVKIVVAAGKCGTNEPGCFVPNASNGTLHGGTLYVDPVVFGWADQGRWVLCHELGHALGLGEGYPADQTGDVNSCMSGSGTDIEHPSQMDYDELATMYGG